MASSAGIQPGPVTGLPASRGHLARTCLLGYRPTRLREVRTWLRRATAPAKDAVLFASGLVELA